MTHDATHILISFCNGTIGAPSLALFDIASGGVNVLRVPAPLRAQDVCGTAVSDRYVFVATGRTKSTDRVPRGSAGPSALFVLDRDDLALISSHVFENVVDAHSLRVGANELDVVSTGTDEVVRLRLHGPDVISEDVLWRPDPNGPRADLHHLNAICSWRGDLVVSGFGRRSDQLWYSVTDGFIECLASGERLATGICHPHSLVEVNDTLAYCESSTGTVRLVRSDDTCRVPGYARGLCRAGNWLFVGSSRSRHTSRSTGVPIDRSNSTGLAGQCSLVRLLIQGLKIEQVVDLDLFGWEIYDLQPVWGVERWPIVSDTEWRDTLVAGLRAHYEERDETVSWLHAEVGTRDTEIARLHGEVANRDRTIEWLHMEVAERQKVVEELRASQRDQISE